MEPPPLPEAYGRVTNPERYRVLHDAADALLIDLEGRYDVTRTDLESFRANGRSDAQRAVRISPNRDDAGPLLVGFTSFPGLFVRFGAWAEEFYPPCGCDACDSSPDALIRSLHAHVAALVVGRLSEEIGGTVRPWRRTEWKFDGRGTRTQAIERATVRELGGRGRRDWQPWPAR